MLWKVMEQNLHLDNLNLEQTISKKDILVLQIIYLALGLGVLIFLTLTLFMNSLDLQEQQMADTGFLNILTMVHFLFALIFIPLSGKVFESFFSENWWSKIFSRQLKPQLAKITDIGQKIMLILRTAYILRLAMLEFVAFFGIMVCFLGVISGTLAEYPIYWINLFSAAFFLGFIWLNFPTREKVLDIIRSRFGDYQVIS